MKAPKPPKCVPLHLRFRTEVISREMDKLVQAVRRWQQRRKGK